MVMSSTNRGRLEKFKKPFREVFSVNAKCGECHETFDLMKQNVPLSMIGEIVAGRMSYLCNGCYAVKEDVLVAAQDINPWTSV